MTIRTLKAEYNPRINQFGAAEVTTSATDTNNTNTSENSSLPKDYESAIQRLQDLRSVRDTLVKQHEESQNKVAQIQKSTRIQTLKSLIPRVLFNNEEHYNQELERAYNFKGMSDDDIRNLYEAHLIKIDQGIKQRGASSLERKPLCNNGVMNVYNAMKSVTHLGDNYTYTNRKQDNRLPVPEYHSAS